MFDYPDDYLNGMMVDEMGEDEDQEWVDEENEFYLNRNKLKNSVSKRISVYELDDLLLSVEKDDHALWVEMARLIAYTYKLTPLNTLVERMFYAANLVPEVKQLFVFLKEKVPESIEDNKLHLGTSRQELEDLFAADDAPPLLVACLKIIDKDSYRNFIYKIIQESMKEYEESF